MKPTTSIPATIEIAAPRSFTGRTLFIIQLIIWVIKAFCLKTDPYMMSMIKSCTAHFHIRDNRLKTSYHSKKLSYLVNSIIVICLKVVLITLFKRSSRQPLCLACLSQVYLSITVLSWLAYDKFVMCGSILCCRYCVEHSASRATDLYIAHLVTHRIVHPVPYCY